MLLLYLLLVTSFIPLLASAYEAEQLVMHIPGADTSKFVPLRHTQPTLYDLLTIESSSSIFFSYARDTKLSARFEEPETAITLLVPTNHAVMALPRKPHQGPVPAPGNDIGITEQEFENRSRQNVERWTSAHVIPQAPISLSSHEYPTLLAGKSITIKQIDGDAGSPEWSRVLLDENIRIVGMKEASNGVLYIIDGTIKVD